jgi:CRP-like cAMP-binding protein
MVRNGAVRDIPVNGVDSLLLNAIGPSERERLQPLLERVVLAQGTPLTMVGEPAEFVWFPAGAIVSGIVRLADGEMVEAALIGNEGIVGLDVFSGSVAAPLTCIVQVPGPVIRVRAESVRDLLGDLPELTAAAFRYGSALLAIVAQIAACNATHSLRQRMARWLLMAHDRAGRDRFRLTHEFIASMINVRRAGVSQFASEMRHAGAIAYTRGEVEVLNRDELLRESCECYEIIRRQTMGS